MIRTGPTSAVRALCLVLGVLAAGCSADPPAPADPALARSGARLAEGEVLPEWVALYDPRRAWNGFTLALYRKQVPILIDMSGRLAHAWPAVRARSRVRLLDDCSLLTIASAGSAVQEYHWNGDLAWEAKLGDRLPHHDVIRLTNGNTLAVVLPEGRRTDELVEIDRAGEVVWSWDAGQRLEAWLARKRPRGKANRTHVNSVQELPPNPWFEDGDERFRPGNLLVSARNLDALFIIERSSGEVVWTMEQLDQQHEALMNGPDMVRPGYVQLFDNRTFTTRRSVVKEIDPRDLETAWEYRSDGFFSATKGAQQALPNGNVLITSSRGWRSFEVTRAGRMVWQWTPPFEPQRPRRYAREHCRELSRLGDPAGQPVEPPDGYAYVDRELYQLADEKDRAEIRVGGAARSVLRFENRCRELVAPPAATLELGFGLSLERLPSPEAAARFSAHRLDGDRRTVLFEQTLIGADGAWLERRLPLGGASPEPLVVCLAITPLGVEAGAARFAYWARAEIRPPIDDGALEELELTEEELEERRRHLRAMGYVD